MNKPLAEWLQPDTSDARVERIWAGIAEADARPARAVWKFVALGAVAAVAVLAFVAWPRGEVMKVGTVIAAEVTERDVKLSDGSQVTVTKDSTIELVAESASELRVKLPSGSATFEVAKRPSRKFIVQAGNVEVRVVGTRFTVRHDGEEVSVSVERGIVEVVSTNATVRLTAGESWASEPPVAAPVEAEHTEAVEPPPSVDLTEPEAPVKSVRSSHRSAKHHATAGGQAADSFKLDTPPPQESEAKSAEVLLKDAMSARRAGQYAEAVVALERLLRDHAGDARAPLAAFELGRLRMDEVSDLRGATQALELSLSLAPRSPFAEDALQRLVKAYAARGLPGPCAHARDDYVNRYPNGAYVESVKGLCPR